MTGNEILSDIVVHNKYARYLGGRRETWPELVMRSAEMHAKKYPQWEKEIYEVFAKYVLPKKIVPSMRSLQFAGKPIELSPNRLYNCAFVAVDNYRAFSETMFLLLGGSGVGFSVQKRHITQLPVITPPRGSHRYVVQDSIVGWSDAIKTLMKAYFFGERRPEFDLNDLRDKGSLLVTSGGRAPGPEPLRECLRKIEGILKKKKYGERLTPIEVFDIQCFIAESVLAGGIRRSATIALFDKEDDQMLTSKTGDWWLENPQRALANISAVLHRKETSKQQFDRIFKMTRASGSGEPGFVWTYDYDMGVNPCVEISIKNCGFCNLTEVNGANLKDEDDLLERVLAATFIGTLQAGYTDFYYLRPEWKRNTEEEALLGVSITGVASMVGYSDAILQTVSKKAVEYNRYLAGELGIRPAKRVTCIKPSGTTSLVLGSSSGIHAWYADFYIRRMRLNKTEALYKYVLEKLPEFVEDDYLRPYDTAVLSIPMRSPEGAVLRSESALSTLVRVLRYAKNWIKPGHTEGLNTHNVSCTVNVQEEEWNDVKEFMWNERDNYTGISLLPYDNGSYQQAPFEEITEEKYRSMSSILASVNIDLTQVIETEDLTDLKGEVACGGGGCEVR